MNPSESNEQRTDGLVKFFCRHLVSLCVLARRSDRTGETGEIEFFSHSGTVINIGGIFFFLTAGHILREWEKSLQEKQLTIESAYLADTFGPDARSDHPIPFDFVNEHKIYIDDQDEGLDFGLIHLRPHYVHLLESNGIKAIFEGNWIHQDKVQFDSYAMLGLPEEFTSCDFARSGDGSPMFGRVVPTMVFLRRLDTAPSESKPTRFPRFVGQLPADLQLNSIIGMSGGPIFGFSFAPAVRYWVVAIQSSWDPQRHITFGCPVPVLASLLTRCVGNLTSEGQILPDGDVRTVR